jgi:hypothetical protein
MPLTSCVGGTIVKERGAARNSYAAERRSFRYDSDLALMQRCQQGIGLVAVGKVQLVATSVFLAGVMLAARSATNPLA